MSPSQPKADRQYENFQFQPSEIEHRYGSNVHILSDSYLLSELALLCAKTTTQPLINELITRIYSSLLKTVIRAEFPLVQAQIPTRMIDMHPEGVYQGPIIDPTTKCVTVNLARAGTLPSHVCYNNLNYLLDPSGVRQDHIGIARTTDSHEKVTGSQVSGHKIGGGVDSTIVLFPDPMGATGGTLVKALDLYKEIGSAKKWIAMHCIVTPEYLKTVSQSHPDLIVYAARLDRGLSPSEVLDTVPGEKWDQEKGLNEKDYIVPGGGGFGEILNNAYV